MFVSKRVAVGVAVTALALGSAAAPALAAPHTPGCLDIDIPPYTDNAQQPLVAPRITGDMKVGSTIRATMGKWAIRPLAGQTLFWYRINDDGAAQPLLDVPRGSYKIKPSDAGTKIAALMIAVRGGTNTGRQGACVTLPRRVE